MKCALTHTPASAGRVILAQRSGSSVLGFLRVTSSRTVTRSPRFKWTTISLLMAACPRTLTFFSRATAGPGLNFAAGFSGSAAFLSFVGFVLVVVAFGLAGAFFLASLAGAGDGG